VAKEIKRESLIDPTFIFECDEPQDKHYQEFKLFLSQRSVKRYILSLRETSKIDITKINKRLQKTAKILKDKQRAGNKVVKYEKEKGLTFEKNHSECLKIERKFGYSSLAQKSLDYWAKLENDVNSKITIDDIRRILRLFNKPFSWEYPLSCYILTGKIITPSVRCHIHREKDRIILEISAEAGRRDVDKAFKQIKKLQPFLQGSEIKSKKKKPKFEEKQKILKAIKKHNNPYDIIDEVYGDNGSSESLLQDNKRRGVIRKTKQRYKKYL